MKHSNPNADSRGARSKLGRGFADLQITWAHSIISLLLDWSGSCLVCLSLLFLTALGWMRADRSLADSAYFNDASVYLSGAESIALGQGYHFTCYVGTPPISIYPPLQSLYLAVWWKLGGFAPAHSSTLIAGMLLLLAATTVLVFVTLRRESVPSLFAGLIAIQVAVSPMWFTHAVKYLSDPLFASLGAALAWWCFRIRGPIVPRHLLGAGAIVALMYLARTAALALVGGITLCCLWKFIKDRDRRWILALAPPFAATMMWSWMARFGVHYGHYIQDRLTEEGGLLGYAPTALKQMAEYFSGIHFIEAYATGLYRRILELPTPWSWTVYLAGLTLLALVIRGIQCRKHEQDWWLAGACCIYLLQLGVWPFPLGGRAVFMLLPWVAVWAWHGLVSVAWRAKTRHCVLGGLALLLAANATINASITLNTARAWLNNSHQNDLDQLASWLRDNIPADEPIAVNRSVPVMHLYHASGRLFLANISSDFSKRMSPDVAAVQQGNQDARWFVTVQNDPFLADSVGTERQWHAVYSGGPWQILKIDNERP